MDNKKQGGRLSGLEVLRGLAATSIIVYHLMMIYVPLPQGLTQVFISSFLGAVPIFFAVSAFSLLYGYRDKIFDEGALNRFYLRRIFRIMPLFYAMLAIYLVISMQHKTWVSNSEIVSNILFLFPFFPGKHESLVWAGWSLGVEWAFYILFPIFALISRGWKSSMIAILVLCVVALATPKLVADVGLGDSYGHMNIPKNLLYFQCGVLIFSLIRNLAAIGYAGGVISKLKNNSNYIIFSTLSALVIYQFIKFSLGINLAIPTEIILAAVCCISISLAYAGLPTWVDNNVSRFLGKISYGTYLVHPLVLWLLSQNGIYKFLNDSFTNAYVGFFACALVSIPLVILAAEISFRFLESPGMALGDRLVDYLKRNKLASV